MLRAEDASFSMLDAVSKACGCRDNADSLREPRPRAANGARRLTEAMPILVVPFGYICEIYLTKCSKSRHSSMRNLAMASFFLDEHMILAGLARC